MPRANSGLTPPSDTAASSTSWQTRLTSSPFSAKRSRGSVGLGTGDLGITDTTGRELRIWGAPAAGAEVVVEATGAAMDVGGGGEAFGVAIAGVGADADAEACVSDVTPRGLSVGSARKPVAPSSEPAP